ncbi:MAG: cell division protein FtsL [Kofleriaceae bacterium]
MPPRLYRLLRSGASDTPRSTIAFAVASAVLITGVLMVRVARHHEVRQLGYRLSRAQQRLTEQRELQRNLELERATLVAPERVRRLAQQLGMAQVTADRIRGAQGPVPVEASSASAPMKVAAPAKRAPAKAGGEAATASAPAKAGVEAATASAPATASGPAKDEIEAATASAPVTRPSQLTSEVAP